MKPANAIGMMGKLSWSRRFISALILAVVVFYPAAGMPGAGAPAAATASQSARQASVDPQVMADTADGQTGSVLVVLKAQADLAAITANLPAGVDVSNGSHSAAWVAQGQSVVDGLRQSAAASQPGLTTFLQAAGVPYHSYWIVNAVAVEASRALVEALAARPDVGRLESNRAFKVPLEQPAPGPLATQAPQGIEPNLVQVGAPDYWAAGITGQGEVFASADTGVEWDHPALKTHYRGWNAAAGTVDHNYNWWDAIRDSSINPNLQNPVCPRPSQAPCDDYGHGTHTTGTAVGDDGLGNQIGMAPGAKWIACRNMDDGTGRPTTYIACLQFFIAPTDLNGHNPDPSLRPDAVDNSYDCPPSELCVADSLHLAVEAVRAAGIFMSVSAGNSGPACATINNPPGLEAHVFTVGAVDSNNAIASFSSRGPVMSGSTLLIKPELVAPGVSIRSSWESSYANLSGTSMAAPHVAGAVLLLWSAFPDLRQNVGATETFLEQHAVPLTNSQGCGSDTPTSVPNNVYGYGRLELPISAYQAFLATLTVKSYVPLVEFH